MIFNHFRFFSRCIPLVLFFTVISGCTGLEKFEKKELYIESGGRQVAIIAEIAETVDQHKQGLMYRKKINDGEAMLFIFEQD